MKIEAIDVLLDGEQRRLDESVIRFTFDDKTRIEISFDTFENNEPCLRIRKVDAPQTERIYTEADASNSLRIR